MDNKNPKKRKSGSDAPSPRNPLPKGREASDNSLYHIAIVIVFGILLCLVMGALDYVSEDTTPTTDMIETIDHFG